MIRVGVHEEIEHKFYQFYSRLHTEIQDIVDSKEHNTINCLFQLAMLAKKELQGRQLTKMKTPFTPDPTSTAPSRTTMPYGGRSLTTPLA
jgi:hypothetical protein